MQVILWSIAICGLLILKVKIFPLLTPPSDSALLSHTIHTRAVKWPTVNQLTFQCFKTSLVFPSFTLSHCIVTNSTVGDSFPQLAASLGIFNGVCWISPRMPQNLQFRTEAL